MTEASKRETFRGKGKSAVNRNICGRRLGVLALAMSMVVSLAGCQKETVEETEATIPHLVLADETLSPTEADETVMALTPDGPILPSVEGVEAEYTDPIPDYLRQGMRHPVVVQLQERLMMLGFMDTEGMLPAA